ncbi:MAG: hypothetical protein ACJAWS_003045 [Oleiphilaceae bacterium]|jgi:hypothetical protein
MSTGYRSADARTERLSWILLALIAEFAPFADSAFFASNKQSKPATIKLPSYK